MRALRKFTFGLLVLASALCAAAFLAGPPADSPAASKAPTGAAARASFTGGSPISASPARGAAPFVPPKRIWRRFLILIWQYKTSVREDLDLYRQVGLGAFHIDRGAGQGPLVQFAVKNKLPYYVDHAADKGFLHLTDRTGRRSILRKRHVVARPHSLADPKTMAILKGHIRRNVLTTKAGPVVAYAFDDEISLGSFNSPVEVDGSTLSVAGYRKWLTRQYGAVARLNQSWGRRFTSFAQVKPVSFEDVRGAHTRPPLAGWNLAPWMDWRSYMDTQFAECLTELTRYTNTIDPATPAGFVGGQQPAPYGGYDYAKVCKAVQWIEAYDIGGTCEILRSLWCHPQRRPYVQTWFSTGDPKRDAWFLWYYLVHGNRGVIAWPDRRGSWFHYGSGGIAPFIAANAETIREVQGAVSEHLLGPRTRFDADPIAVYYSHPSVQASWVMDAVTHKGTWPNRSSGLDNTCQTAGKNRVAWFKLLEDCGFQYNVVTAPQVAAGHLVRNNYRMLVLNRAVAISDAEADAIRDFVRRGGTVIADHLTGVLDSHGRGRATGALDDMFGIKRDESAGYLDARGITEIDGELYSKPFVQRLRYDGALRHKGIVIYERGTRVGAPGATAAARVRTAHVVITRRHGRGTAVYLNLTPVEYYDVNRRIGSYGQAWRTLLTDVLADTARLHPRARVLAGGKPVPMAELLYWRNGPRLVIALVKNPTRQGSVSAAGQVHGVTGKPITVTIRFRRPIKAVKNLRTQKPLPAGTSITASWKPSEALLFEATAP